MMTVSFSCSTLGNIENAFEEHDLVPDILRVAPKKILNVRDIKNSSKAIEFLQLMVFL